ncbi:DUF262 domain-containing protein [Candidatus Saccharibacteria bacterium]|nr:DUF262 domain-containing protein [Candidatus Saccharibacteria bacterium]
MIKTAGPKNIADILNLNDKNVVYTIPKYQRAYTWKTDDWDKIFDDILDNESGYFLGSMICVSEVDTNDNTIVKELIDGQQRTTSLSLILLAIYNKLKNRRSEITDDDDLVKWKNLGNQLYFKRDNKKIPRLKLQIQNCNDIDYESLLFNNGLIDTETVKQKNAGNRRIYKAYNHFLDKIDEFLDRSDLEKKEAGIDDVLSDIQVLFGLADKFNNAVVVLIDVETHTDAFMMFESLNFRGEKLSAIDLIKNTLMSASEKDGKIDECYNDWQTIQRYLGEEYSSQERFFRQYYNAHRKELNEPFYHGDEDKKYPLAYKATRSTVMDIYEKLIKNNYASILKRIKDASKKYAIITNNEDADIEVDNDYKKELLNLERIQGTPSYTLLIYLELNRSRLELDDENLGKIVHLLTVFFTRRNVTDYPNTRNLDKIFMDLVEQIKESPDNIDVYELIRGRLVKESSSDEDFEKKLKGPLYLDNDTATRYILCTLESLNETKEIYSNLWSRDKSNKYIWTIEHIFPEGENIPDEWVRMIVYNKGDEDKTPVTEDDRKKAEQAREEYVHTLGNLTITGYNSNLSNMPFTQKRDRVNSDGKYIGYKNGLALNVEIAKKDKWTIDDINNRTNELIPIIMKEFSF